MKFSFCITSLYENVNRLRESVQSIIDLKISNFEILVIGNNNNITLSGTQQIYFDEDQKSGWITKKKNILINESKFDNIVLMHDYFIFDSEWYKQYLDFGEDWDVCSNSQLLINGKRHFTDWVTWDDPMYSRYTSLNYDDWSRTKNMYQSGGYMLVKKSFMKKFPWNESMIIGTPEDVEWSLRMRTHALWKCNGKSIVKHNKIHRDAK